MEMKPILNKHIINCKEPLFGPAKYGDASAFNVTCVWVYG